MFNLVFHHFSSLHHKICPISLIPSNLPSLPSSPPRNTERIIPVLGTHTNKSRHLIFIPSNITTLRAKNTPNYTKTTSWSSANMSPKSPVGIGAPVGRLRNAPRPMDTWMFAPERNTHCRARTRFSRISRGGPPPNGGSYARF